MDAAPAAKPPTTGLLRRLRDAALLWLPPVLCSAVYLPCVTYSEWYIDELFAVLRNEDARGETPLRQVFQNDFWGNPLRGGKGSWTHKSYRPLSVLSFAWQFRLLGEGLFRPQPLRAFNVALHTANALLVLAMLRMLGVSRRWSRLAACLFAAHPVHAENIVYLVGRADAMATTGWLLAALLQLGVRAARPKGGPPRLCASLGTLLALTMLAVLAGLCKESGLTLLVFAAGLELCSRQAAPARGVAFAVGALALFALVSVIRFQITQGTSVGFGYVDTPVQYQESRAVRAWSYLYQHAFYAKLLVLPGDLSWDYSFDALPVLRAAWRDLRALGVLTAYLGTCAVATWGLASGRRRVVLGLQQVIVPFVPASNLFFTVGVTVGERLLYPSTVGAALVLAAAGEALSGGTADDRGGGAGLEGPSPASPAGGQTAELGARKAARRAPAAARGAAWPSAVGHLLLGVYVCRCARRVWQWRSSEALYTADAAAWPRSVKTQHQVGTVYHAQSRYDEALLHYNASLAILDDNALTDHCIAQIYIETGRFPDALARFEKILRGHGVGFSHFNLWMLYIDYGFTLVAMSRFEEGIPALQTGLQRNTAVPHGLNALGFAQVRLEMLQDAQDTFAKGLEYDPDNGILWNNLAVVWMTAGAWQQAVHGLERALTLEPEHPSFVYNAMLLKDAAQAGGVLAGRPRLELFFSRLV